MTGEIMHRPRALQSELRGVEEEIVITRMAVEILTDQTAPNDELLRHTLALMALIGVIERLVQTAKKLSVR